MNLGEPDPRTVSGPRHNVSLSAEMIDHLGVRTGERVYVMANPDRPNTLVIMNAEMMQDIVRKGWISL